MYVQLRPVGFINVHRHPRDGSLNGSVRFLFWHLTFSRTRWQSFGQREGLEPAARLCGWTFGLRRVRATA